MVVVLLLFSFFWRGFCSLLFCPGSNSPADDDLSGGRNRIVKYLLLLPSMVYSRHDQNSSLMNT